MEPVVAFTYKASSDDTALAQRILDFLGAPAKLFNIPQYTLKGNIRDGQCVITFGTATKLSVTQYLEESRISANHIPLPALRSLYNTPDNQDARAQVASILDELRPNLKASVFHPETIKIVEGDLPDLDARQILMLERITERAGKHTCIQTSKNGKVIQIGREPLKDIDADFYVTFEELYTMKLVMDVLGVKEVKLVNVLEKTTDQYGGDSDNSSS